MKRPHPPRQSGGTHDCRGAALEVPIDAAQS